MPSVRITAKDMEGKQFTVSVPMGRYSDEQLMKITEDFRMWIREGKPRTLFKLPPVDTASETSAAVPPPASKEPTPLIPKGDVLKLEPPNNGGCSFLLVGSTRSGKSTAMLKIYEKFFKKHITLLLTHSSHADIYKPLQKSAIVSPGFFPELVNEPMTINRQTKNKYDFCLIFDDLAMDGKNDADMTKLLTIGRNSGMSAIICGQRLQMLNPTGRTNCNYVCLFRLNTDSAIKDVVETYLRSYLPPGMPMAEMIRLYKELTADHHFFLVNTLEDTIHLCRVDA